MAKFNVTLYYHTNVTVEVEAENEHEARNLAYAKVDDDKYNDILLDGLQSEGSDVDKISD
jgi:hypothetical protein